MKKNQRSKRDLNLPRVRLPQQTGGHQGAGKGRGSYNRQQAKLAMRRGEE